MNCHDMYRAVQNNPELKCNSVNFLNMFISTYDPNTTKQDMHIRTVLGTDGENVKAPIKQL